MREKHGKIFFLLLPGKCFLAGKWEIRRTLELHEPKTRMLETHSFRAVSELVSKQLRPFLQSQKMKIRKDQKEKRIKMKTVRK